MSGWQNFAKWKEMYHSGAEEAAIRSTLPFWHVGKQIWRRLGLKKKKPTLTKKTGGTNTAQPLAVEDGIDHHCPDDDWMRSNFDRDTCVAYVPPSFRNSNLWQAWMLFERCRNWLSALLPTEIGRWASFKETHHLLLTRTLMRESNEKGRIRVCSAPNVEKQKITSENRVSASIFHSFQTSSTESQFFAESHYWV